MGAVGQAHIPEKVCMKFFKYCHILLSINWFQSLYVYLHAKKPRSSSIRVLNKSVISVAPSGKIVMGERSFFEINRQDYLRTGEKATLFIAENAALRISGSFTMHGSSKLMIHKGGIVETGNHTYLNGGIIECSSHISIGDECAIADGVRIMDNSWHNYCATEEGVESDTSVTDKMSGECARPVKIGNHVWIATNAVILPGVTIGDGAVVAAGAVVTKSVPERCMVAGVPAKVIRNDVMWKH